MIDKVQKDCTGCSACMNACPKSSIEISYKNTFFYEPKVDYDKCVSCKKCISVCPAIKYESSNSANPKTYAVYASDELRKESSSGGAFSVLAEYILDNGGYVCGAAWAETWDVHHIIIDNKTDLQKLRLSKYVQSYVGGVLKDIKKILNDGKIVLFSGTPCQNAGLRNFLGKDYENLYMIDVLCHGAPSPKVWSDYLEDNYDKKNIKEINFRNKENGWMSLREGSYNIAGGYIDDGQKKVLGVYNEAFLNHRLSNESCMECKYKFVPRSGDFTIGDFWYYPVFDKTLNDGKGLSVMLLNNSKAEKLFARIQNNFKYTQKLKMNKKWEYIEVNNRSKRNPERSLFFRNYEKYDVKKSLELACGKHFDVALLTMFNGMNYGSGLVAYAQNKILENLGYTVLNVHKPYNWEYPYTDENQCWRFAKNHYYISRFFDRDESCRELNSIADTFIVGSDTPWWWADVNLTGFHYWLDFVEADKKKLSFCTSFANSYSDMPETEKAKAKYLYSRFDALSVREKEGKDILKNTFGVDSEYLIDPTFIIDKSVWDELAENSNLSEKDYLLAYILDFNAEKEKYIKSIAEKLGLRIILIPNPLHTPTTDLLTKKVWDLEDFVYLYKNASFVVTDSFHGTCFSVIYKKKFFCIINMRRGGSRFELFREMKLGNRLVTNYNIDDSVLNENINYSISDLMISEKRKQSVEWLDYNLTKKKEQPTETALLYDYLKSEIESNSPKIKLPSRFVRYYKKLYKFAANHRGLIKKAVFLGIPLSFVIILFLLVLIIIK